MASPTRSRQDMTYNTLIPIAYRKNITLSEETTPMRKGILQRDFWKKLQHTFASTDNVETQAAALVLTPEERFPTTYSSSRRSSSTLQSSCDSSDFEVNNSTEWSRFESEWKTRPQQTPDFGIESRSSIALTNSITSDDQQHNWRQQQVA
eukprot:gene4632-8591_t